jgi:hypothetical protein
VPGLAPDGGTGTWKQSYLVFEHHTRSKCLEDADRAFHIKSAEQAISGAVAGLAPRPPSAGVVRY